MLEQKSEDNFRKVSSEISDSSSTNFYMKILAIRNTKNPFFFKSDGVRRPWFQKK